MQIKTAVARTYNALNVSSVEILEQIYLFSSIIASSRKHSYFYLTTQQEFPRV